MIGPVSEAGVNIEELRRRHDRDPETLARVAMEFESLLVGEILKCVRESSSGGWLGGAGESGTMMVEVAEQQLARAIASGGGLGLSGLVAEGLAKHGKESES